MTQTHFQMPYGNANLSAELLRIRMESEERHARTPAVSFAEYRQKRYRDLDHLIKGRKSIYLDMKFWIWLRNPAEAPNPSKTAELLELLKSGVKARRLWCPVSYAIFLELMKQNPMDRRVAQCRVMDELSEGIGLRNPFEIAELEYMRFFATHNAPWKNIPIDPVWAPVGHIVVETSSRIDALPRKLVECGGQKVMLDVEWAMRMEHLAARMDAFPRPSATVAAKINLERQSNLRGGKSFEELFEDELRGLLDVTTPHIENSFRRAAEFFDIKPEVMSETDKTVAMNLIVEVVRRRLDGDAIPSQRVGAALYAAIRQDDRRLFKENDFPDIGHSSVAVAYCDAFLTERDFAALLLSAPVRKVMRGGCRVISDIEEAVDLLS